MAEIYEAYTHTKTPGLEMTVEHEDIKGLSRMLEQFARGFEPQMVTAMDQVRKRVYYHARDLAPIRTGKLQSAVYTRPHHLYFVLGCRVPYAVYQEFGTKFHPAQPFLEPAIENYWGQILGIIEQEIELLWRKIF